jgi:hypothetical protein
VPAVVALVVALALAFSSTPVHAHGVTVNVPVGWHVAHDAHGYCDPERLLVVSSAPIRHVKNGNIAAPSRGQVIVAVLEDHAFKPAGDLRRPRHFAIDWQSTSEIAPCCGTPDGPASMHWFRQRGRYLGFIVYIGRDVPAARRAATEHMVDSLTL